MIISFSLENWRSFRDKSTISCVASKQRTHKERLTELKKYKINILPVVAIYGGNASGKSNICEAFEFAQDLIVKGTTADNEISVKPFLLSSNYQEKPSRFWFEFLIDDKIFEFSFSATKERITNEKLVEISTTKETILFERDGKKFILRDNDSQLDFISKGTRPNQLFLTNCIDQNNVRYKKIYDWFKNGLTVIKPESKYLSIQDYSNENKPLYRELNTRLNSLDTGIKRLGEETTNDLSKKQVRDIFLRSLLEDIREERYINYKKNGEEIIKKLVSYHEGEGGKEIKFNIGLESDGTMRLIDILPAFVTNELLAKKNKAPSNVFVIDELDRSLHYMLIRNILEKYLSSCNANSRSQIMFTTHDLLLMDQDILRRDEMYVVERDNSGASSIFSLNEYKGIRYDKNILKSYLNGRFGGIPRL